MSVTFEEFLSSRGADAATLEQAARYYLAEVTDDLSTREMREQLVEAAEDEGAVDRALASLERDPSALAAAAREILAAAWQVPEERARVTHAVDEARTKLPVVEVAILAIAAMYGMWLLTTKGIKETSETKHAGEVTERRTVYYPPDGPLRAVVDLFKLRGNNAS